ncbi:MAG: BlaI/MecI/CopY family transcriptional regulator [Planctomycetota bacterium]
MGRAKKDAGGDELSRRERQVMNLLYAAGESAASDIQEALADGTSNAAVRSILRILEEKGHVRHRQDGPRYLYRPRVSRDRARRTALEQVVDTFFDGSAESVLSALLEMRRQDFSPEDVDRMEDLISRLREGEEESKS